MQQVIEDTSGVTRDFLTVLPISGPRYARMFLSYYYGGGKNSFKTADGVKTYAELLLMAKRDGRLPSKIAYSR